MRVLLLLAMLAGCSTTADSGLYSDEECRRMFCPGTTASTCIPSRDDDHPSCDRVGRICQWGGGQLEWTCQCDHRMWKTYNFSCAPGCLPDGGVVCRDGG